MIYLLSTIVYLSFAAHKLEKFSLNPGKLHLEGLVYLLGYIWDNKNLGLNLYADMKYSPLFNLWRQANIKTENQLMSLYYSSWKYFPDTGKSTGVYMIFYQGGPIDYVKHVPGRVAR